jgi:hypothetical protein
MNVIPLASLGLETVAEVSARKGAGWSVKIIQVRIRAGELPVVVVGEGRSAKFLLRTKDVDAYTPPGQGARTDRPKPKRAPRKTKK